MRVLLDESLPRRLKAELTEYEVSTVPEAGWAGTKNGELLRLAEPLFDVFVTMDRRLPSQQNLSDLALCVIVLLAKSKRGSRPTPSSRPIAVSHRDRSTQGAGVAGGSRVGIGFLTLRGFGL